MKRSMADTDPRLRYRQAMADARKHFEEIEIQMDLLVTAAGHTAIDWAHVGDANRLRDELKQIADRLLGRGEYAG